MGHDFAYRLAMQHPWAITEPALEALIEMVRVHAGGGFPEINAAVAPPRQRGGAIGVIPVRGTIRHRAGSDLFSMLFGGATTDQIAEDFRAQMADESVRAIVLDIDSPGGSTYGITELANEIYKARGKKPIIAVANDVSASAAYWIGSAADQFYATPSALVGSIGVYALHEDVSKMAEEMGVKVTFISAGKFKTEGNEFEPLGDEARAHMQSIIDETYEQFVKDVARGRGVTESTVRNGYGQGRVVTAKQAKSMGMIDGIYTLEQAIARAGSMQAGRKVSDDLAAEADTIDIQASQDEEGRKRLALIRWRALEERAAV